MSGDFLLFAGRDYYPGGGWNDFVGAFDTLDAAQAVISERNGHEFYTPAGYSKPFWNASGPDDWAHIVHDGSIVAQFLSHPDPTDADSRWALIGEAR